MSAHGIVDQIAADWREVIDGHDPGTDWGPDAKRLVDLALEGARRIENKRALRQAKVRLWCHRLGLMLSSSETWGFKILPNYFDSIKDGGVEDDQHRFRDLGYLPRGYGASHVHWA